jgi:hypothetical protein
MDFRFRSPTTRVNHSLTAHPHPETLRLLEGSGGTAIVQQPRHPPAPLRSNRDTKGEGWAVQGEAKHFAA